MEDFNFTGWKNQYIDLVHSKPEYIIAGTNRSLSDESIEKLRAKQEKFRKVICELGSGSGEHLIEQAKRHPDTLFIGFELRFKRAFRTAEKAELDGVKNLIICRTNALTIFDIFSENSLDGIYVNFPDPWAKKRWKKHRLLTPDFFKQISVLLKKDGFFSYKTDSQEYFVEVLADLKGKKGFKLERISYDLYSENSLEENIPSEFEKLFISKNKPICLLLAKTTKEI